MAWHPHTETSKNPPEDGSFYDALWPLDLVVPGLGGPSSSPRAGAGPPTAEPTSAGSRCRRAPSSERGRKEPEEPRPVGKSQKTIYSFLQMATGTIWLTNTDEQA